ncbi:MAG TPA: ArsR family transcriptional regulator [Prolixibacteraceae bacterium]|nr:ArsR family transcriptional regulator [Prolixibacteraceae bacterium]
MNKSEKFEDSLQELAQFARAISHPARLSILKYLAETKTCISGDISDNLPLSRTTVSQHLKELRDIGLIHGTIDGLKINYCLCQSSIEKYIQLFDTFFDPVKASTNDCEIAECAIDIKLAKEIDKSNI